MRTLKGQDLIHDENYALYPDGAIVNETETQEGTPVVREVYNDFLMNVYAFIKSRGFQLNELEDNLQNGYQFLNALKRNVNELNDIEKILNLNGSTWNIDLNFDVIPNKYFVFARATENYSNALNSIKGVGATIYQFESNGFKTGDELLIIIDSNKVRSYNLSNNVGNSVSKSYAIFGKPLRLRYSEKIWYEKDGILYSDVPESYDLQRKIQDFAQNTDLKVLDIFEIEDVFICHVLNENTFEISFYYFNGSDFNNVNNMSVNGFNINENINANRKVEVYFDGNKLAITNGANTNDNDFNLILFDYDLGSFSFNYSGSVDLENSFEKTTNSVFIAGGIINFINGVLNKYKLDGTMVTIGNHINHNGIIFRAKEGIYFCNDSNAVKWELE